ncbi:MAG: DUF2808 domain-containing protein [Aphanocapsa feldmannii 277cI]|nr:MAG: DUF2808 domain-containing protein [Aphanocapsa feldmannii 277cI]
MAQQHTQGLMEFRWDQNRDYCKLPYLLSNRAPLQRSDWTLLLPRTLRHGPIHELLIGLPPRFDGDLQASKVRLAYCKTGRNLSPSRCAEPIDALIEPGEQTRSLRITIANGSLDPERTAAVLIDGALNPWLMSMVQINALARSRQGSEALPHYLGSWVMDFGN